MPALFSRQVAQQFAATNKLYPADSTLSFAAILSCSNVWAFFLWWECSALHAMSVVMAQREKEACSFAEASTRRLDAMAEMVRGAASVAFAGSDASSRRMRHHLFRWAPWMMACVHTLGA